MGDKVNTKMKNIKKFNKRLFLMFCKGYTVGWFYKTPSLKWKMGILEMDIEAKTTKA
jgi:hypothetical protein